MIISIIFLLIVMNYQVLSPIPTIITADSFKEAIKNYVKFNHNLNLTNLITIDIKIIEMDI